MKTQVPAYLEVLNPEQREAVFHTGKPLLILAGAGSGKTRVITTKIAWLIREKDADPHSILAVTFTNKAAREMAERARQIDERAGDVMLRTFHSFGAWFLRRYGNLGGLDPGFVIYDDDDSAALLATIMEGKPRTEVRAISHKIARAKDFFLSPDDPELDLIDHRDSFRTIYAKYEKRLNEIGNVDFGDLIKMPVRILREGGEAIRRFKERFKMILVDEYQDTNIAQSELLKELVCPGSYLCVVGDDDQSIYRFRGAEVKNILSFSDNFGGADIIRLERNYRSTSLILKTADSVVNHNVGRLGKTLVSEREKGKQPVLTFLSDQDNETRFCAELILESMKHSGNLYSNWALVYRTNAQSLGFETEFLRRRIPYRVVGSLKFYEREEVKDILALLSFLVNPRDEVAFRRVANKPSRGLGPSALSRITEQGGDLALAAEKLAPDLSKKAQTGVKAFLKAIEAGRAALSGDSMPVSSAWLRAGVGLSGCVVALATESGIAEYHLSHDEITGNQRLGNIQEVANAASLYPAGPEGLLNFLEHIELDRSIEDSDDSGGDKVTLITLHNTKGLEFRRVIITGIEQGIFPRDDKEGADLEEERRLFYVGATRAMDELYLTSCAYRRMYGRTMQMQPSIFLKEIDQNLLRITGKKPGGYGPVPERKKSGTSSDGRWAIGDRVYNDDHGYGYVSEIREDEDGPIIRVSFETGHQLRFLSEHQSSNFQKIREERHG
ncbi:MAG: ATP-dependent helicase [Treponema sp.]|nr:ATP-dependent helicase [Treponema sp.]